MISWLIDGELSLSMYVMIAVFSFVSLLFWFGGVPYLFVKFSKPVSKRMFNLLMILYVLVITAFNGVFLFIDDVYYKSYNASIVVNDITPSTAYYIIMAVIFVLCVIAGIISCNIFKYSNGVDVTLPHEYKGIKPVKAKVMSIDDKTVVEYNGKNYVLSKNFNFRLRDTVKVRIIEDRENCYIA